MQPRVPASVVSISPSYAIILLWRHLAPAQAMPISRSSQWGRGSQLKLWDRVSPTVAGMVLFGHEPQGYNANWGITALRIRGQTLDRNQVVDRRELTGTADVLSRKLALELCLSNNNFTSLALARRNSRFPRPTLLWRCRPTSRNSLDRGHHRPGGQAQGRAPTSDY